MGNVRDNRMLCLWLLGSAEMAINNDEILFHQDIFHNVVFRFDLILLIGGHCAFELHNCLLEIQHKTFVVNSHLWGVSCLSPTKSFSIDLLILNSNEIATKSFLFISNDLSQERV